MWIGSDKELIEWLPKNAVEMSSNKINFTIEKYYKCNVYVHQAKVHPGNYKDDLCNPKLMVMTNGTYERTKVTINFYLKKKKKAFVIICIYTLGHQSIDINYME